MATASNSGSNNSLPLQTLQGPVSLQPTSSLTLGNNTAGSSTSLPQSIASSHGISATITSNAVAPGQGTSTSLTSRPPSPTSPATTSQSIRTSCTQGLYKKLLEKFTPAKEPENGNRPRNLTVILCVYGFVACVAIIFGSAKFASLGYRYANTFRWLAGAFSIVIVCAMGFRSGLDEWFWDRHCRRTYSRNLGNTVLQTTVASVLMICLFLFRWYPMFHQVHLVLTSDVSDTMSWPSLSLLQRLDWSSEANIYSNNTKCFVRWYDESAPTCPTSRQGQDGNIVPASKSCNCKELWSKSIEEDFMIGDIAYRLLRFGAGSEITASAPDTLLWVQAFFDYNATKAEQDNGWLPQPGLSIALYDPSLSLESALALNRTRLIDIDASAITSINIGVMIYESLNGTTFYDYDITTSPRTSTTLTCNTGGNGTFEYLCATTLQIRIPSFMRTRVQEQADMNWVGMAVEAGAWYSLAQFVGWTLSGAAFAF